LKIAQSRFQYGRIFSADRNGQFCHRAAFCKKNSVVYAGYFHQGGIYLFIVEVNQIVFQGACTLNRLAENEIAAKEKSFAFNGGGITVRLFANFRRAVFFQDVF
jgi:hypothetical protein